MIPKISTTNLRVALDHPNLISLFIMGYGSTKLIKKHFAIHLQQVANMKFSTDKTDSLKFVSHSIDLSSKFEFPILYLYFVCRYIRPDKVVETGVFNGISSASILKALEKNGGHLYSIDLPNVGYQDESGRYRSTVLPAERKTGFIIPESLKTNWTLISGDSREKLPVLLQSIGEIDIFHHDSRHTYDNMMFEYETIWPYLKYNGLLLSHNVDWNNAFKDFCQKHAANYFIKGMIGVARKIEANNNLGLSVK